MTGDLTRRRAALYLAVTVILLALLVGTVVVLALGDWPYRGGA